MKQTNKMSLADGSRCRGPVHPVPPKVGFHRAFETLSGTSLFAPACLAPVLHIAAVLEGHRGILVSISLMDGVASTPKLGFQKIDRYIIGF